MFIGREYIKEIARPEFLARRRRRRRLAWAGRSIEGRWILDNALIKVTLSDGRPAHIDVACHLSVLIAGGVFHQSGG